MSNFDASSTAEDVTSGIDLTGRTALVTGCNSGIGLETMRVLALRGAHVFGAARTLEKAQAACEAIEGRATPIVVELTEPATIREAASIVARESDALDMLVLNAGVMALTERRLVYGVEMQFAVNHLGHFLLTHHLLDSIKASDGGRVAVVSSALHHNAPEGGILFDNLAMDGIYDGFLAYGQSKLANVLFASELARRLEGSRATANSLHPGVIKTNLIRHLEGTISSTEWWDRSVEQGAATSCYVASHPALDGVSGLYFADCNPMAPSVHGQDEQMARRLWEVSESLLADHLA